MSFLISRGHALPPRRISAEILSQGEEVLFGDIVDSNAAWLSQALSSLGVDVLRHTVVGDRLRDIEIQMIEASRRVDICLCSGGLGPTCDDLTREAAAAAFDRPLQLDQTALEQIRERYRRRCLPMPELNRKQALIPQGAVRIDNHWGTAPGFRLVHDDHWVFCLPGVPSEMRQMFKQSVEPEIQAGFQTAPRPLLVFRTFGVGESDLQERLDQIQLPDSIRLGFRVDIPYVDVKFRIEHDEPESRLKDVLYGIREALGDVIVCETTAGAPSGGDSMTEALCALMTRGNLTLAMVEGVSTGGLARQAAPAPWFLESLVMTDVNRLADRFGAPRPDMLDDDDWSSALASIAKALRDQTGADYAVVQLGRQLAVTAAVCVTWCGPNGVEHHQRLISGSGERRQLVAAAWTLDVLRRELMGLRQAV